MSLPDPLSLTPQPGKRESVEVVRLSTSCWKGLDGSIHLKKSLLPLKRKSTGYQILKEDCDMAGVMECLNRIENLYDCEDGVYEVVICNELRDWETNCVEDYDYKLVPHVQ